MLELLQELSLLPGVSGREDLVRERIAREVAPYAQCKTDPSGNLIAYKKGAQTGAKTVLFSAHMDEVGFIVTYIEESGLLRFAAVGGIDTRVVVGKSVLVGDSGLYGVIGTKAIHMQSPGEQGKAPSMDDLYIDIGASSKEEAEKAVHLGDRAKFASSFEPFGQGMIKGPALDDRAGCAILIQLLKQDLPYDIVCAFTVQEETGCLGGKTAAFGVNPDIGVILEATTASDIAGVEPGKQVCQVGGGPVLSFMDKGTIYDFDLYRQALAWAGEAGIPCQSKAAVAGGNESRAVQSAAGGAKVLGLSLPFRYLHSPSCVLQVEDMENDLALVRLLAQRLPE